MRIYDQNLAGMSAPESGRSQETQQTGHAETRSPAARSAAGGDQVELSSTVNSLSSALSAYNANRGAKVQALAAQYEAGTYRADSLATSRARVADSLLGGTQ
jgi:anti-sigma28 factor (negative regulator of flagellin synthesis)